MEARAVCVVAAVFIIKVAAACGPPVPAKSHAVEAARSTPAALGEPPQLPVAKAPCPAEEGPPPDCAALPEAACLGATLTRRACETVGPLIRPSAAVRWLDCGRIVACGLRAAGTACVDGAFRDLCGTLAAQCVDVAPEITGPVCEQLLGAFRPEHRQKLIDCLRQGCGTGAFGICLP
jgi:hypothetical protein